MPEFKSGLPRLQDSGPRQITLPLSACHPHLDKGNNGVHICEPKRGNIM